MWVGSELHEKRMRSFGLVCAYCALYVPLVSAREKNGQGNLKGSEDTDKLSRRGKRRHRYYERTEEFVCLSCGGQQLAFPNSKVPSTPDVKDLPST